METASIPGGEAAPEPQTTAPAPTETSAPQTTAPEGEAQQAPAEGDIHAELAAIRERLDQNFPSGEQVPTDLMSALSPEEPLLSPEEEALLAGTGQPGEPQGPEDIGPDAQAQMQALDNYVSEQVQAAMQPLVMEQRSRDMEGLAQKYPDILQPEILKPVSGIIEGLIQRTGNDDLRYDAKAVEIAYLAAKAQMADVGAVSAEQAATTGASLETQAGQTQAGSSTPEQDYVQTVYGDRSSKPSVFE
jgi:hypothetical protein